MDIHKVKHIYFLGIGGIGMSALARWFHAQGYVVGGYDRTPSDLTAQLIREGMDIHYENQAGRIPTAFYKKEDTLVVFTPAVPEDHVEVKFFRQSGYQMFKRAQVLGQLTERLSTLAISGTHGKTTTSSMTAHILKHSGIAVNAFLGGITANYNSNLLIGDKEGWAVVEADEFDRSFHTLYPRYAVVTSMDPDHLDIYGTHEEVIKSFAQFVLQIKPGGRLLIKEGLELPVAPGVEVRHYGLESGDVRAANIHIHEGVYTFDYVSSPLKIDKIQLLVPGFHNVENALAAITMAFWAGVSADKIKAGIESFRGVKRRFEYVLRHEKAILIDDYAHHPKEVEAILRSVKALYPQRKLTCAFQPHLYSRTKDLAAEFARSLSLADEVWLLDIYPARELPIPGVSSELIFSKITSGQKICCTREELSKLVNEREVELLVTAGAGDIDSSLGELKMALIQKNKIEESV